MPHAERLSGWDLNSYKVVGSEETKYLAQTVNSLFLQLRSVYQGKKYEAGSYDERRMLAPVVRYVERRNMHIRIANEVTTETELRSVVDATSDPLGGVSEFCVCPDYHESVGRYAFWVELQGNLGASTITAPSPYNASLHDLNENYLRDGLSGKIDMPVVRVLWKIRTRGGAAVGQIKVPVVVWEERAVCDV
ncbi:hypothetical protein EDD15DRAFT_2446719 [Pisolithus albus]|nr:hypothetical protein EDD15DRAFT_2446719 [Pisolithus albus]